MESSAEGTKLGPLSPFKFYGGDAPRKISKDPRQVLEPLMEWAEKAHWKKGGLAGHKRKDQAKDEKPKLAKSAKDYCFEERIKELAMDPTREEFLAMKPDLDKHWDGLSLKDRERFEAMHTGDVERYEKEMEEYKKEHPEYEAQLKRKNLEKKRKSTTRRSKRMAKKAKPGVKVIYSEDEVSDNDDNDDDENSEAENQQDSPVGVQKTPVRNSYSGAYEFTLSPRSIRRQRREALRQ